MLSDEEWLLMNWMMKKTSTRTLNALLPQQKDFFVDFVSSAPVCEIGLLRYVCAINDTRICCLVVIAFLV